jgi:hypothetical protein
MFTAEQLEFAAAVERFCADSCGTGLTAAQTLRKELAPPIYGGANEIQREIIRKNLGL